MSLIRLINEFPIGNPAERGFFLYKSAPPAILKSIQADNFRKTVRYVAERSPFYKRKFEEHGIDASKVKMPADLGDFFTTAEDIRRDPEEFVCQRPDTAYETTGTTSKRTKRVYFSRQEVKEAGWAGSVGLWALGIRPGDRIASAFDYSFWVSGPVLQASCEALGCFHVEAGRLDPAEFYDRLSDYKLSVIVGDPSWLMRLSEIAEKKGPWPLKLLIGGGENVAEDTRRYVEKVWKADYVLSYGQTEAFGAIGMESLDKQGYHLNEFHNHFEIVDPRGEGYGELVYTNLNRRVMPLVRYRSGDITRFLEGSTPGGLPGTRIAKLKGRVNEWVATAIGNIAPWMFEPVFARLDGLGEAWQIEIGRENNKDLLRFHAEVRSGFEKGAVLKENFFLSFEKEMPEAWRMAKMGLLKMEFEAHAAGDLRQGGRKLPRLVDKRNF